MEILKYPDPALCQRSEPVTEFNQEIYALERSMFKLLVEQDGIGLAAPQVGVFKRLFVVKIFPKIWNSREYVFINPEILAHTGISEEEEGCLSVPEHSALVQRSETIVIGYQNNNGKKLILRTRGMLARVIQHEMDHLDGKLIKG